MWKLRRLLSVTLVLTGAATSATTAVASAALAAPAHRADTASAQDAAFITSNAQSTLAEISRGQLGAQSVQDPATKQLAAVTLADHTKLQAELAAAAAADGITLPTAPNAVQLATAQQLAATSPQAFDLAYAQTELMGHQLAIAAATTETTSGSAANVKSYAAGYVPIATGHRDMAEAEVVALSKTSPVSVPAGTGGLAATRDADQTPLLAGIAAALALAAGSVVSLARRRRAT